MLIHHLKECLQCTYVLNPPCHVWDGVPPKFKSIVTLLWEPGGHTMKKIGGGGAPPNQKACPGGGTPPKKLGFGVVRKPCYL